MLRSFNTVSAMNVYGDILSPEKDYILIDFNDTKQFINSIYLFTFVFRSQ
jgi:hypothetical protein